MVKNSKFGKSDYMGALAIREKLKNYIEFAEDKKVKAIYTMIEKEIEEEYKWWNDERLIADMNKDCKEIKSGKQKGYSMEEIDIRIDALRKKRNKTD